MVVTRLSEHYFYIFLGKSDRSFADAKIYFTDKYLTSAIVADLNGDAELDIIATHGDTSAAVLLGYENGSFANQKTYPTGT